MFDTMTRQTEITVDTLDAIAMADAALIEQLCALINEVYTVAEEGIWRAGAGRTSIDEVSDLVAAGEILVATTPERGIVGSVRCHDVAPDTSEFGLLVAELDQRNIGIGRALLDEVERRSRERGLRAVQLELLVPRGFRHPSKEFLRSWYLRRGYRHVSTTAFEDAYPHLAPLLATPCELQIHRKELAR